MHAKTPVQSLVSTTTMGYAHTATLFCIACSADGASCSKCHADFSLSSDKASCEETGCAVPAKLEDGNKKELLTGDDSNVNGPACSAGGNIVPSQACYVTCSDGHFGDSGTNTYECKKKGDPPVGPTVKCTACGVANCKTCPGNTCTVCKDGYVYNKATNKCDAQACPNSDEASKAGQCTLCGDGFHGALKWDSSKLAYDSSDCTACPANCEKCEDKANECKKCESAYDLNTVTKVCKLNPGCLRGFVGRPTYDSSKDSHDTTEGKGCTKSKEPCVDSSEQAGACTDCADGYIGSLGWDYSKATDTKAGAADVKEADSPWNRQNCKKVTCPVSSEEECKTCPEFTDGKPEWDDLFNTWEGCISNDFGFSGPSASWSGSVSADRHTIDVKSAEMLHIANGQYDVSKNQWVCDEGYAGVGCKQRLCPETIAFVSGTDTFTPSLSAGSSITSDVGSVSSSTFSNQHSYRECGGRGTCDFETGLCECFVGFTGVGCQRTTCPNRCSGHGVCVNDDVSNYHAAGGGNIPSGDINVETWGNLWGLEKFQGCRCDGGWGGADCSLRQCPRGDDPETACNEDLGNDVQIVKCSNVPVDKEAYFKLRFTTQLGLRYNTRAIVVKKLPTNDVAGEAPFLQSSEDSIQTALESLPNFAVPKVEVTGTLTRPTKEIGGGKNKQTVTDFDTPFEVVYEVEFTDPRNAGELPLLEVQTDAKCLHGVQPKYVNSAAGFSCTLERKPKAAGVAFRENKECSGRGLCNRKTAECNCFDGYTGLSCDTIAQTY